MNGDTSTSAMASISDSGKPRGRPQVGATHIGVRVPPDQLAPLDAWITAQPDPKPSRPEVIRLALREWLTGLGLLKHHDDPEGAN